FVDNQVSASTGTVRMRGVFPNPRGNLKPGLFARIRLPVGQPYKALLVPDEALQSDQGLRVLKEGVAEGERVIVGGMQRVRPGVQVEARLQAPPPRPESPLARLLAGSQGPGARSQGSGVRGQ